MNWYKKLQKLKNRRDPEGIEHPEVLILSAGKDGMRLLIDNVPHHAPFVQGLKDRLENLISAGSWSQAKEFCKLMDCKPE